MRCAGQNALRNPQVLEAQVRRMLRGPKAGALVGNFDRQWLGFRAIELVKPDPVRFMAFNVTLEKALQRPAHFWLNLQPL